MAFASDKVTYPKGLDYSDAPHLMVPFVTIALTPNGEYNVPGMPFGGRLEEFPLDITASADPTPVEDSEGNPAIQWVMTIKSRSE
jgi:hypothetical protein